jgi:hypothetical protein
LGSIKPLGLFGHVLSAEQGNFLFSAIFSGSENRKAGNSGRATAPEEHRCIPSADTINIRFSSIKKLLRQSQQSISGTLPAGNVIVGPCRHCEKHAENKSRKQSRPLRPKRAGK